MKYEHMFHRETYTSSLSDELALIAELVGEKATFRSRHERRAAYRMTGRA